MPLMKNAVLAAVLVVSACSGDDDAPTADAPAGGADAPATTDAGSPGDRVTLITGDWTIPAGDESYICVRYTVPETYLIKEFHPIIPPGTHHTVLTVDNPGTPDNPAYPCSVGENGTKRMFYGTGVGANPFYLPEGVAIQLEAGEQLVLNLHLYNAGDDPISGTSGVEVVLADPSEVEHVSDSDLFGKLNLLIPPGPVTQSTTCTVSEPQTYYAISPHMHQLGVHARAIAHTAAGDVTLLDLPYDFDEQLVYLLPATVDLVPGDTIDIDCVYDNTTGATVTFGDSSNDEMCFIGAYRYPAGLNGLNCQF
jgi:hypothetical protein